MTARTRPLDPVVDALAHEYRRDCLTILDEEQSIDVEGLAARIASRQRDAAADSDAERVRSIRIALRHVHLPKLEDCGLVAYTSDAADVFVPADAGDEVARLSSVVRHTADAETAGRSAR